MLQISKFEIENSKSSLVTDSENPAFSFSLTGEKEDEFQEAVLSLNDWTIRTKKQIGIVYAGKKLEPFFEYTAKLEVISVDGKTAEKTLTFRTGKLNQQFQAQFISDPKYEFIEKKTSPIPLLFAKEFTLSKKVKSAFIYSTAIGIYQLELNGKKISDERFAPGFTSYKNQIQYQTYDVSQQLLEQNEIRATVAGGWAVGAFGMDRKNRITAKRQAFLLELHIEYCDGSKEILKTDDSWKVSENSKLRFAEFYDGEIYDSTIEEKDIKWHKACVEKLPFEPNLISQYGPKVIEHERFIPEYLGCKDGGLIFDFKQNFAGVVSFKIRAHQGDKIVIKHSEVLDKDGFLQTQFLRTAKAQITYIAKEGENEYTPSMTYMGFRYCQVFGVKKEDVISLVGVSLYSDIEENPLFTCSNENLNRLEMNIRWSGKSNFVEIPTDCPQRDERMGWTGDIALFSSTACFDFDMRRFLIKWMKDLRAEQGKKGELPNTVPNQGYTFPLTMPKKAVAFWGDAVVFVPYALYRAYGDERVLEDNYEAMKKYVDACLRGAHFGIGKHRYIWSDFHMMQFGDWVSPDSEKMSTWQKRCKWTGTCSIAATSSMLSEIAEVLGKHEDAKRYQRIKEKVSDAYVSLLTDKNGKLKNEFQTAYVLPLYFQMFKEDRLKAAANLAQLVKKADYCIQTGFPGTPYLLFALADNGQEECAFKVLLNTKCPSWLYEVENGATTIWERYDALKEENYGKDGTGGMLSFNHYAFGAVGDFFYRRILGIEPKVAGYKSFTVKPLLGGSLKWAKGGTVTPYGPINVYWRIEGDRFVISVDVPFNTTCEVILPSGDRRTCGHGEFEFAERIDGDKWLGD